jgi:surface polysaccharide O-acyltransferase-like enzyme
LVPLALLLDGPAKPIRTAFRNLPGPWLVLVPIVPLMLAGTFVYPHFPYISHDLTGDWYAHAVYFTFFLCGFLVGRDPQAWETIAGMRKQTLLLAVAGFALLLAVRAFLPDEPSPLQLAGTRLAVYANRWLWILTILGWGHRWLNRPFRWLPYANEAVYPWYILHQTIIIAAGYELSRLSLGPVVEPALVLLATVGGCFLLHEFVIRRTPLLRPLFGLSYRPVNRDARAPGRIRAPCAE